MCSSAQVYPEQSRRGFTLIELLVVVAIIAILSTIGISVFTVAQQKARDGKRMADINNIAKSIETSKDYSAGTYTYSGTALSEDFPRGITADTKYIYCIQTSTSTTIPADPAIDTTWTASDPPTDYSVVNTSMEAFDDDIKSWKLCARLESSTPNPYCLTSLTSTPS